MRIIHFVLFINLLNALKAEVSTPTGTDNTPSAIGALNKMKEITLTQGFTSYVDDEDYDWLMQWKWHVLVKRNSNRTNYAARSGSYDVPLMHRLIMGCHKGDNYVVDHKDHNGLNNQKHNLRVCSIEQNAKNTLKRGGTSSKYIGVSLHTINRKGEMIWAAQIMSGGVRKKIGRFYNERDAAVAYNNAAKELHGEYATINIV